MRHHTSFNNSS